MNKITVFTPTYNRAYCLHKCYESMLRQTCKEFDWLIVDDGSTDGTRELVQEWISQGNEFNIRYTYKPNGGMHTAYNTAYEMINTELAMNVDSDDWLTDTAIEDILTFWKDNKRDDVGGIYALDCYENGSIIGLSFPDDLKEFHGWGYKTVFYESNGQRKRFKNRGDKKFIGVTSVITKYPPIPVFEGEKYHSLYFKQHLIEQDYSILIYNKPVCVVQYMEDGSSNNMYTQYVRNPKGFCNERRFVMQHAPSFNLRFMAAVHYVAESMLAKDTKLITNSSNKGATLLALPAGTVLYLFIMYKVRETYAKR